MDRCGAGVAGGGGGEPGLESAIPPRTASSDRCNGFFSVPPVLVWVFQVGRWDECGQFVSIHPGKKWCDVEQGQTGRMDKSCFGFAGFEESFLG